MKVIYMTKRDINGNYKYLAIDHARKEYATSPHGWTTRAEAVQVTAGDLRKIRAAAEAAQYKRIDTL